MGRRNILVLSLFVAIQAASGHAAQETPAPATVPGQLRLFAIAPGQSDGREALHRAGWVEADGRLLRQQEFPELYAQIGRAWTRKKLPADLFAVPNLVDRRLEANPYGVLGPGDLLGGNVRPGPPPPVYFIYVGKDAHLVVARWK
jgi:hypothetical protein